MLAVGLGLLVAGPASQGAQSIIALSPAQLQSRLSEHFPIRHCLLELACLTLAEPRVQLVNGDPRIYLSVAAVPEFYGGRLREGVIEAHGEPRYEPSEGAFYVDGADLSRLDFPDLPEGSAAIVAALGRLLLVEVLTGEPVWRLDERDARQAFAKLVLRGVEVRGGRLLLKLGDEDEIPSYSDEADSAAGHPPEAPSIARDDG